MNRLVLEIGEHRGANFEKLLAAVVRHNLCIGKGHRIGQRSSKRIFIKCSRGEECAFAVNAVVLTDGEGIRITRFDMHNCEGTSVRKRQVKSTVISALTDTVDGFVVTRGRQGGNNAHLKQMVKDDVGIELKTGQAHNIIRAKRVSSVGQVDQPSKGDKCPAYQAGKGRKRARTDKSPEPKPRACPGSNGPSHFRDCFPTLSNPHLSRPSVEGTHEAVDALTSLHKGR